MSRLVWDEIGAKKFQAGVENGVLYPMVSGKYPKGVAWNGLINANETVSGGEANTIYADDIEYAKISAAETIGLTIEAYDCPDEFDACDGSVEVADGVSVRQQKRQQFGFAVANLVGNDTDGIAFSKKISVYYGCQAAPSERTRSTINESIEAGQLSWTATATRVPVPNHDPSAVLVFEKHKMTDAQWKALEDTLYGTEDKEASLPMPAELIKVIEDAKTSG